MVHAVVSLACDFDGAARIALAGVFATCQFPRTQLFVNYAPRQFLRVGVRAVQSIALGIVDDVEHNFL